MTKKLDTPEEIAHAKKRDKVIKETPQRWDYIQKERQMLQLQKN